MGLGGVSLLYLWLCGLTAAVDEGSFWHVTDFHYDFSYFVEGHSCNKKVPISSRGDFGSGWCDSPWSLVNNSVYAMRDLHPDVDFIIWTGDNVLHTKNEEEVLSTDTNVEILNNITDLLSKAFPNTVTYPAYGNHDYFPDAQFPASESDLYRRMEESWRVWINSSSISKTLRDGGYFTSPLSTGKVHIVSLNTNLYYNRNKRVAGDKDPAGQFEWLDSVLSAARNQRYKVLIIGHVPPGVKTPDGFMWFYPSSNSRLIQLLANYTDVIAAIHLGHDHESEFKIIYDSSHGASVPVYLAPSVTPWRYVSAEKTGRFRNPGIRLVKYDRQTGAHLDYLQYYLDLERANEDGRAGWKLLYRFTETYKVPDISASSLSTVRKQILNGAAHTAQTYFTHMVVNGDTQTQCDAKCRTSIYCGMRYFEMVDYQDCVTRDTNGSGTLSLESYFFYLAMFCIHLGWQDI